MKKFSPLLFFLFFTHWAMAQRWHAPKDTSLILLFDAGSYQLDSLSRQKLKQAYQRLIVEDRLWYYCINISGYADAKGSDSTNYRLSKRRAQEVGNYFYLLAGTDTLEKTGTYDYMTACNGVAYDSNRYKIPIDYQFFGEWEAHFNDSLKQGTDRKVVVHFRDNRGTCLGTFRTCALPAQDISFGSGTALELRVPKGSIDYYTSPSSLSCKYDSAKTRFNISILDSLSDSGQRCRNLQMAYASKKKQTEFKIGSIYLVAKLNEEAFEPVCPNLPRQNDPMIELRMFNELLFKEELRLSASGSDIGYRIHNDTTLAWLHPGQLNRIDFFVKNKGFKRMKLKVRGASHYRLSTKEPVMGCMLALEQVSARHFLFMKSAVYTIIKFSEAATPLTIHDPDTGKTISVDLDSLTFKKNKRLYILKRKSLSF